jgi:hypothetical protein
MSRSGYHKKIDSERKMGKEGMLVTPRKAKPVSRVGHMPKTMRKVRKSEMKEEDIHNVQIPKVSTLSTF